jgi:signal peptidase II
MKILTNRKNQIIIVLGIFFVNYILDRVTKYMAVAFLKGNDAIRYFNNLFVLTYAENTGAFLSLGKNWNIYIKYGVLLIIPIIICIMVLLYLMIKEKRIYRIIIGSCVIGGGIGNLVDRLFNNFTVIDFMNFGIGNIRTGILNVADLSVTFGVIILILFGIILEKKNKQMK